MDTNHELATSATSVTAASSTQSAPSSVLKRPANSLSIQDDITSTAVKGLTILTPTTSTSSLRSQDMAMTVSGSSTPATVLLSLNVQGASSPRDTIWLASNPLSRRSESGWCPGLITVAIVCPVLVLGALSLAWWKRKRLLLCLKSRHGDYIPYEDPARNEPPGSTKNPADQPGHLPNQASSTSIGESSYSETSHQSQEATSRSGRKVDSMVFALSRYTLLTGH